MVLTEITVVLRAKVPVIGGEEGATTRRIVMAPARLAVAFGGYARGSGIGVRQVRQAPSLVTFSKGEGVAVLVCGARAFPWALAPPIVAESGRSVAIITTVIAPSNNALTRAVRVSEVGAPRARTWGVGLAACGASRTLALAPYTLIQPGVKAAPIVIHKKSAHRKTRFAS